MADETGGTAYGRSEKKSMQDSIKAALDKDVAEHVVLFGYSRGAITITEIAEWTLKKYPCANVYLVGIDPVTVTGGGSVKVPKKVKEWTNWYQKNGGGSGIFKVLTFNFANLDGTPFSGGKENNHDLTGVVKYNGSDGPVYVNHADMPAHVKTDAVSAINGYKSKK